MNNENLVLELLLISYFLPFSPIPYSVKDFFPGDVIYDEYALQIHSLHY